MSVSSQLAVKRGELYVAVGQQVLCQALIDRIPLLTVRSSEVRFAARPTHATSAEVIFSASLDDDDREQCSVGDRRHSPQQRCGVRACL
jgi:hypothetical protein